MNKLTNTETFIAQYIRTRDPNLLNYIDIENLTYDQLSSMVNQKINFKEFEMVLKKRGICRSICEINILTYEFEHLVVNTCKLLDFGCDELVKEYKNYKEIKKTDSIFDYSYLNKIEKKVEVLKKRIALYASEEYYKRNCRNFNEFYNKLDSQYRESKSKLEDLLDLITKTSNDESVKNELSILEQKLFDEKVLKSEEDVLNLLLSDKKEELNPEVPAPDFAKFEQYKVKKAKPIKKNEIFGREVLKLIPSDRLEVHKKHIETDKLYNLIIDGEQINYEMCPLTVKLINKYLKNIKSKKDAEMLNKYQSDLETKFKKGQYDVLEQFMNPPTIQQLLLYVVHTEKNKIPRDYEFVKKNLSNIERLLKKYHKLAKLIK